jgi:hypothetical protein
MFRSDIGLILTITGIVLSTISLCRWYYRDR